MVVCLALGICVALGISIERVTFDIYSMSASTMQTEDGSPEYNHTYDLLDARVYASSNKTGKIRNIIA